MLLAKLCFQVTLEQINRELIAYEPLRQVNKLSARKEDQRAVFAQKKLASNRASCRVLSEFIRLED